MATHRAGRRQNKIARLPEPHITIARYIVKISTWKSRFILSIVNYFLKVKS